MSFRFFWCPKEAGPWGDGPQDRRLLDGEEKLETFGVSIQKWEGKCLGEEGPLLRWLNTSFHAMARCPRASWRQDRIQHGDGAWKRSTESETLTQMPILVPWLFPPLLPVAVRLSLHFLLSLNILMTNPNRELAQSSSKTRKYEEIPGNCRMF